MIVVRASTEIRKKVLEDHFKLNQGIPDISRMSVRIETNIGDFTIDLYHEQVPKTAFNFLKLCKLNYFAFSIFLRCEPNFVLQGGDPSNTGRGGESIWQLLEPTDKSLRFFPHETIKSSFKQKGHSLRGTVSMASAGKDKNASQFFITLADDLDFLDDSSTVFGHLTSFKPRTNDTNDKSEDIEVSSVDTEPFFEYFNNDVFCDDKQRPLQDIYIKHTTVLVDPFPDPKGFDRLKVKSPEDPTPDFLKHERIGAEKSLVDEFKGKTEVEIEEENRERTAASSALVLEIIGDLPSAHIKPPENVLFVCKLNPVTQSDDLRMIFSRFGKIITCEVIRDRDTRDSLGYAFIEFEDKESCAQAYLKMDNVLIDDRRIKVDFSQSVSKLHKKWLEKRQSTSTNNQNHGHKHNDYRNRNYTDRSRRNRSRSRSRSPRRHRY